MNDNDLPATLDAIAEQLQVVRDQVPHGEVRSMLNLSLDRMRVAASKLQRNENEKSVVDIVMDAVRRGGRALSFWR